MTSMESVSRGIFWTKKVRTGVMTTSFLAAAAGLTAYAQQEGGIWDLHDDAALYAERAVKRDPGLNPQETLDKAMQKAGNYENGRVITLLGMAAISALGTAFAWRKAKAGARDNPQP